MLALLLATDVVGAGGRGSVLQFAAFCLSFVVGYVLFVEVVWVGGSNGTGGGSM